MYVFVLPCLKFVEMSISGLKLTKSFGVRDLPTISSLYSNMMVQHFVVYDAFNDVLRHVPPIQNGVDTDDSFYVRIAAELNCVLLPDTPVGAPGNCTGNLAIKILTVHLIKKSIEIEKATC